MTIMFQIPEHEITRFATASQGPGGQHVNKTASKIELRWNVRETTVLDDPSKQLLLARLANRIGANGELRVSCQITRSQHRNLTLALEKMNRLVNEALKVAPIRVASVPTESSQNNRLASKNKHSQLKSTRRRPSLED